MAKKVLLVDDEPAMIKVVKLELEAKGYEVDTANSGDECLERIKANKPDVLLIDNVMQGKTGAEVAKILKNDPETKDVRIIMVSGKGEMVFSEKTQKFEWMPNNPMAQARGDLPDGKSAESLANAYGVDDYISKPFDGEVLVQVIEAVLKTKEEEAGGEDDIVFD